MFGDLLELQWAMVASPSLRCSENGLCCFEVQMGKDFVFASVAPNFIKWEPGKREGESILPRQLLSVT
jgi:hypothetical protein